jgi:hypothetical protein
MRNSVVRLPVRRMNERNLPSRDQAGSTPDATTESFPVATDTAWMSPVPPFWKYGAFVE